MNWAVFIAMAVIAFLSEYYQQRFKHTIRIKKNGKGKGNR
jgi:hypothetical protein